jgi:pyruvate,water dikinase
MSRFFEIGGPPAAADAPDALKGNAGSPGTARGPAKVVRSLSDAAKLQRGDVLVAETTAPSWTPLFATAAAIVTDAGGVLSHCAVVAREYGIPAVVGTGRATMTIRDGRHAPLRYHLGRGRPAGELRPVL